MTTDQLQETDISNVSEITSTKIRLTKKSEQVQEMQSYKTRIHIQQKYMFSVPSWYQTTYFIKKKNITETFFI